MIGAVIIWPHTIASIPSNWHLCDGTHGTEDLRGYYLCCAANEGEVGNIIGSNLQSHTFTGDGHVHSVGAEIAGAFQAGSNTHPIVETTQVTGTTDESDNRPLTKKFPFIQRIS